MHEFSLAQNILEITQEQAKAYQQEAISEIIIEIGQLSGIEIEALQFALQSIKENTIIEKADIIFETVTASVLCNNCGFNYVPEDFFHPCPQCGSPDFEISTGKELKVRSITF